MDVSGYKRHALQNNFAASQTINAPEKPIFQTVGGAWRKGADDKPAFYRTGADISGTTLVDTEYYKPPADRYPLSAAGKWVRLNPRGGLQTLPENKDKPHPDNISAFDWQGYEWVDASQVPADYSSEGKTISFAEADKTTDERLVLRRYLQQNVIGFDAWMPDIGGEAVGQAAGLGIKVEAEKIGERDGQTIYRTKISDDNLKALRQVKAEYFEKLQKGLQASKKGQQEATNMAGDTAKVIGRAVVNTVEGTANLVLEIIDPSIQLDPHNLTRARIGDKPPN